jgi:hypothetical protein
MPRFRTTPSAKPAAASIEFDLCARCAAEGEIIRTVVTGKLGVPAPDSTLPAAERIPHRSYDFQPRPTPCISCARILSSEDD